jgi:hypothetical protein
MTKLIMIATSLALVASCKNSNSSADHEPARAASAAVKIDDPPHPSGPANPGKVFTVPEWLTLRGDQSQPKDGETVTLRYHTAKDEPPPCLETNEDGKWTCVVNVAGKRTDGEDAFDAITTVGLAKAQTAFYIAKIKPDVDVTLTCKISSEHNSPSLVDCR